jgi:hypothetical protein
MIRWGFIDATGAFRIEPRFEAVRSFAEGLAPVKGGGKWGYIDTRGGVGIDGERRPGDVVDTRLDVGRSGPPTFMDSARWIYVADTPGSAKYGTEYLSFNAPETAPVAKQCGRAVFSDVHLSGMSSDKTFPAETSSSMRASAVWSTAIVPMGRSIRARMGR